MTERTEWDDTVDEAIGALIDDDTEGFALTALQPDGDGLHLLLGDKREEGDAMLLAIFMMIEELRQRSVDAGTPLTPKQIMYAASCVAMEHGYLDGEAPDQFLVD